MIAMGFKSGLIIGISLVITVFGSFLFLYSAGGKMCIRDSWVILLYFAAPSLPGWATKNWLPTLFAENLNR